MDDREKLIKLLSHDPCVALDMGDCPSCKYVDADDCYTERMADHLLSHGVTIREQGEWVQKGAWHIECSECHYILAHVCEAKNYCPYCGAPMKGESNVH